MKGQRGELIVLGLLGALLIVASVLTATRQQGTENDGKFGSTHASGPDGARALYLWLEEMDYATRRLQRVSFELEPDDGVLWILAPELFPGITEEEAEEVADWVRDGGTLVWANSFNSPVLFEALGIEVADNGEGGALRPVSPWISYPGARYEGRLRFVLHAAATPLLADESGAIGAMRQPLGRGEMWLFGLYPPFSNEGLRVEANSALVEGLLSQLPSDAPMTFDEQHHGFGGVPTERSLLREMRSAPWGWAIYYGAGVIGLWILLRGRSFGRPLPLPGEHLRREAGEFARSMAWLYRRARLRAPILRHYHARLKREVAERYRLAPREDDSAFVSDLARARPDVDQAALLRHLQALRQPNPSETELLALARAHEEWLSTLSSRRR